MNKFVKIPTSLNNLKIKVDDLDVCKLKNVLVKKSSNVNWIMKLLKIQNLTH